MVFFILYEVQIVAALGEGTFTVTVQTEKMKKLSGDTCPGAHSAAIQERGCHTIPKIFSSLF